MNVEESRLRTFRNWPANAAVDPQRIAKAGFYYTGRDLEVECFCCGGRIQEWNYGDQVMARHRRLSPTCPFVRDPNSSGNVPLCGAPRENPINAASSPPAQARSGGPNTSHFGMWDQAPMFRSEAARLDTYRDWPVPHIVAPEQLAKAGLYYLGRGDKVKCAFCSGAIGFWEEGDDPEKEHRRHFPTCPFLYNIPVGNVPLDTEAGNTCSTLGITDLSTESAHSKLAMKELGIQSHHGPRSPKYATVESRLRTFVNWPSNITQKPEDLAAAGFYYTGNRDQVRCFHCDGGLRLWDPSDDPWMEHARWFNSCGFITLVKGEQFVKQSIVQHNTSSLTSTMLDSISPEERPQPIKHNVTDSQLQALMSSEPVVAALGTGVDISRIKMALRWKLEQTGSAFPTADALIEAALDVQLEEEAAETLRSDVPTSSHLSSQWRQNVPSDAEGDDDHQWETETEEEEDNEECIDSEQRRVKKQSLPEQHSSAQNFSHLGAEQTSIPLPGVGAAVCVMSQSMPSLAASISPKTPEKNGLCRQSLPLLPSMEEDFLGHEKKDSLEEENRRLKEARQCKICMDSDACVVFLPCGHLVTCVNCAPSLTDCPICRQPIKATVRTFLS